MGTHSSASLPHQVGSPPQKVGSYQAEFSMSLLRLYHHHSTDVIRDQCRIFLHMSSTDLPSSSFKKKASGHASAMLAHHHLWCCVRPKKPSKHQKETNEKWKKSKAQGPLPLVFGGMMWWFGWYRNSQIFWVEAGEKVMGIYEKWRQHTY